MRSIFHTLLFLFGAILPLGSQPFAPEVLWSQTMHVGQVQTVILSPDESIVASGAADGSIKLWPFTNTAALRTLVGHSNYVTSLAFSSNGQFLISGSHDLTIRVWQVSDGTVVRSWIEGTKRVNSIALSPDNSLIAAGSGTSGYPSPFDGAVRIWNAADGTLVGTLTNNVANLSSVTFSPDGQLIAAACVNGAIMVWRVSDTTLVWKIDGYIGGWSGKIAFSPDSQWLAYGAGSGLSYVGVRRASDGVISWATNAHQGDLQGLAFTADGRRLVSVGSRSLYTPGAETTHPTIMVWNATNGLRLGIVPTPSASVESITLPPSGAGLLTGEGTSLDGNPTYVRLWQTNGALLREWGGHSSRVTTLAFSTNGNVLASTGSADRSIKLWRGTDGVLLRTLKSHLGTVAGIAFSPDGTRVVYGDNLSGGNLRSVRVSDGATEWLQPLAPLIVYAVAFSPNNGTFAAVEGNGVNNSINVRRASNGDIVRTIPGLTNATTALAYFPTNLAALSANGLVRFWLTNGTLAHSFNVSTGFTCGTFSSDATLLAIGYTNREVRIVRTANGAVQQSLTLSNAAEQLALSADKELLITVSSKEMMLWRVADGALLHRYTDDIASPASLAISPRGEAFAFGKIANFFVVRKPDFFLPSGQPTGANWSLRFSGEKGINYSLEASTELSNWLPYTNILCPGPAVSVSVPFSTSTNRFYRLAR